MRPTSSRSVPFCGPTTSIQVPNVQIEFVPLLGELQHGSVALENGFQYFLSLMRPESEGRVWIDTPDPLAPPKFVFNYLAAEEDRRAGRGGRARRARDGRHSAAGTSSAARK